MGANDSWVLLINVHARAGEKLLEEAVEKLRGLEVPLTQVLPIDAPERLGEIVRGVVDRGPRHILVGGGDGTVSAVAAHLANSPVELGVLPLGTGNDFARNLGIPPSLEEAVEVIAHGVTARVDMGKAGDTPFLNAASLGLSAAVAQRLQPTMKRLLGKLAYPVATLSELPDFEPFTVKLEAEGLKLEEEALQVVIGNGRFHGAGRVIAPEATLDDRQLHTYLVVPPGHEVPGGLTKAEPSVWEHLRLFGRIAMKLRSGEHVEDPNVLLLASRALTLHTEPALEVNVDGEILGTTPMTFSVLPKALRVRVPRDSPLALTRAA